MLTNLFRINPKTNKRKAFVTVALVFVLTASTFGALLPTSSAHSPPWNYRTWTYVVPYNNIIGINQQEKLIFWLGVSPPPTANGAFGDRWSFYLDITKPDGAKETLGPLISDPVGGSYTFYTPTQVGTYTVVARFPGKTIDGQPNGYPPNWGPSSSGYQAVNDTYAASTSDPVTFTATQAPLQLWPEAPLPTQFWTRPINSANFYWAPIAANWLGGAAQIVGPTSNFAYGNAPESPHILWKTPAVFGGLMDARFGAEGYATSHYEGINFNPLILNGKIYYNAPNSGMREGRYIVDLYTGKELQFINTTGPVSGAGGGFDSHGGVTQQTLSFAQILNVNLPNQMGGYPYLWSTSAPTSNTWIMYDAYTGNTICQVANASNAGTAVYGKDGSILRYNIVNAGTTAAPRYYLQVWNTTQAIWWHGTQQMYQNGDYSGFPGNNYYSWRPYLNATFDGSHGYSLNASIPAMQGSIRAVREDQYVIGGTQGSNNENGVTLGNLWALNIKPDSNGKITPSILWNITFTPPSSAGNVTMSFGGVDPEDKVFTFYCVQTKQRWGYSLETGKQIWGPTAPEDPMKYYGMPSNVYKGMLISYTYLAGGIVYAYNITTGKLLWQYEPTQIGYESPYGDYPAQMAFIADNKIFIYSSPLWRTNPLWRGSYLRVLNATNGQEIWKVMHYGSAVIADGIVVGLNYYDNEIYAYGKGASATTITANPAVVSQGDSVLIQGTVTDQSPGAKDTPAIADDSQQAWMEYLYQQQAKPTNSTGVSVHITAVDPNGNWQNIGTVNSDASGNYALMWTPPVPGVYKVTATFDGSKSYWGSFAEIAFGITAAKSTLPLVTPTPQTTSAAPTPTIPQPTTSTPSPVVVPPTSAEPTATYIGIGLVVIIILTAATAFVLKRKRA